MTKGVPVAYDALPSTADYETVRPDVERQLPLRNIHWVRKSSASRTIRTIQALPLDVRPLESFGDAPAQPNLLERPYLYLLFVVCDDNEVYRATLRTQIREWLDSVTAKQHQEWLIVHVTSGRSGVAKFYQRKGAIVDKIKADFNVGKKDRCIQVAQGSSAEDPTAWAEFLTKVKEGIVATFDSNVGLYEENVRKADSQRQLPGWQFLLFFRQKEALAESFEATTLYEDALIQYDELEASFFQSLKEHNNAAWFQNLGGLAAGDDSHPILSTTVKPFRKLIETNSISVFDFRTYLFARQATMLFHLGRVIEAARRGAYFISTFARTLREHQTSLGTNFVESWTYSACLSIVDECERRISQNLLDVLDESFTAVKAELLELARKQLDKIGMSAGHLPPTHPFSMSLNESSASSVSASSGAPTNPSPVTRRDLLRAISELQAFDDLYVDLTNRTIQAYQSSGRWRSALKLHSFLAAFEHHRQRFPTAQKLYSQLPAHYTDARWALIESYLLSRSTQLQTALDMPRDRLLSTLALVRSGMVTGAQRWELDALVEESAAWGDIEKKRAVASSMMKDVYELSSSLSKDFAAVAFPTFSLRLQSRNATRAFDEDAVVASVLITNHLPCPLTVDEVRFKLSTSDGEQVWFTAGACELRPGETRIAVQSPTSATGVLLLELSQLRFSRIIFQYSHRPTSSSSATSPPDPQPCLFVPRDHQSLQVSTDDPPDVALDRAREVIVNIDVGRNRVIRATVRFSCLDPDIYLDTAQLRRLDGAGVAMLSEDGAVTVENISPYHVVKLRVPVAGNLVDSVIQFTATVEYFTSKRPQTRRLFRQTLAHSVALPIAVNVQDYFREHCLLSKFSVTTDGVQGVKVRSARIEGPPTVEIKPCRDPSDAPVFISPLQTANFLFKLLCDEPAAVTEPLRLVLSYSTLESQVRFVALAAVDVAFHDLKVIPHKRWVSETFLGLVLSAPDSEAYSVEELLKDVVFEEGMWRKRAQQSLVEPEAVPEVLQAVRQVYENVGNVQAQGARSYWRTLEIPLDLPFLHVLNLVRVETAISRAEVGQAIPATLFLRSSFRWSRSSGSTARTVRLAYTVMAEASEWIVSGQARGEFLAQDDEELSIPLTLIPLRPSALFLPSIAIQPLASSNVFVTCETQHVTAATCVEVLPITHRTTFEIAVPLVAGA
ncbi:hypothetical protein JCM8547_007499 [Rhodosporidiobolus lusitaniae]